MTTPHPPGQPSRGKLNMYRTTISGKKRSGTSPLKASSMLLAVSHMGTIAGCETLLIAANALDLTNW